MTQKRLTFDTIPHDWVGETAVIVASGPTSTQADIDRVRGKARVIAINMNYQRAPWADVLWFCDQKWWTWHRDVVKAWAGEVWTIGEHMLLLRDKVPGIRVLPIAGNRGMDDRGIYTGRNSGYQAIQLAAHRGANKILLIGFDMRVVDGRVHWHENYRVPTRDPFQEKMLPHFPALAAALKARGVTVINCTFGSALRVWPIATVEDALCVPVLPSGTTRPPG